MSASLTERYIKLLLNKDVSWEVCSLNGTKCVKLQNNNEK